MDAFERLTHAAQWKVMMAKLVEFNQGEEASVCIELIDPSPATDINVGVELAKMGLAKYTGTQLEGVTGNGIYSEEESWDD